MRLVILPGPCQSALPTVPTRASKKGPDDSSGKIPKFPVPWLRASIPQPAVLVPDPVRLMIIFSRQISSHLQTCTSQMPDLCPYLKSFGGEKLMARKIVDLIVIKLLNITGMWCYSLIHLVSQSAGKNRLLMVILDSFLFELSSSSNLISTHGWVG